MKKRVYLFGAGASFGAGSILPERPPLGLHLYPALHKLFPGSWACLPSKIAVALAKNFEEGMKMVYEELGMLIPQLMREMAIYFIEFRPVANKSLYCKLIQELLKTKSLSQTIFSTINYDCILEFSLLNHKQRISYFDAEAEDEIPVLKLHGSCNMFNASIGVTQAVKYSTGVRFSGKVKAVLDVNEVVKTCLVGTGLAPVMCLYMREKPVHVSAEVIFELQSTWAKLVEEAETLIIIGVKPLDEDAHIWNPIANSKARKFFVGNQGDWENWINLKGVKRTFYLGPRFSTAFEDICDIGGEQ